MPRKSRIVVPEMPHHVIQRGNRRQPVFFYPNDKTFYLKLLKEQVDKHHVKILAYCLMDNHVHLILVPSTSESLAKAVAETHRRFTCHINIRYSWRGYLWQGRFNSFVMDEPYLLRALRYVENNPVRAGIVKKAEDYQWSSAHQHVNGGTNALLSNCPVLMQVSDWRKYLNSPEETDILTDIRTRCVNGLPLVEDSFLNALAQRLGAKIEDLKPKPQGRPKKS